MVSEIKIELLGLSPFTDNYLSPLTDTGNNNACIP